jgi:hypothetical protein
VKTLVACKAFLKTIYKNNHNSFLIKSVFFHIWVKNG